MCQLGKIAKCRIVSQAYEITYMESGFAPSIVPSGNFENTKQLLIECLEYDVEHKYNSTASTEQYQAAIKKAKAWQPGTKVQIILGRLGYNARPKVV